MSAGHILTNVILVTPGYILLGTPGLVYCSRTLSLLQLTWYMNALFWFVSVSKSIITVSCPVQFQDQNSNIKWISLFYNAFMDYRQYALCTHYPVISIRPNRDNVWNLKNKRIIRNTFEPSLSVARCLVRCELLARFFRKRERALRTHDHAADLFKISLSHKQCKRFLAPSIAFHGPGSLLFKDTKQWNKRLIFSAKVHNDSPRLSKGDDCKLKSFFAKLGIEKKIEGALVRQTMQALFGTINRISWCWIASLQRHQKMKQAINIFSESA